MTFLLQFIFSWNKSTETTNVGLLMSPRSSLNFLYLFHDLFMFDIYQVFVQKLIVVMIHIMKLTGTLFMSRCHFYNTIKLLPKPEKLEGHSKAKSKIKTLAQMFSCEFCEIFRNTFLQNTFSSCFWLDSLFNKVAGVQDTY